MACRVPSNASAYAHFFAVIFSHVVQVVRRIIAFGLRRTIVWRSLHQRPTSTGMIRYTASLTLYAVLFVSCVWICCCWRKIAYTIHARSFCFVDRPHRYEYLRRLHSKSVCYHVAKKKHSTTISFPYNTSEIFVHNFFMNRALREAERAADLDSEVPIGAVVVRNQTDIYLLQSGNDLIEPQQVYEILAEQHNCVEKRFDASAHAEILALRDSAAMLQNWRLINTTLYSTLEPCPMCLSAAQAFRVHHIVYGAPDVRLGACGTFLDLLSIAQHPYHNISKVTSGIYANESAHLLRKFFRQRRVMPVFKNSSSDASVVQQKLRRWWQLRRLISFNVPFYKSNSIIDD